MYVRLAYSRTRQDQRPTDPIHPLHVFLHIYDMRGQEMGWAWHAHTRAGAGGDAPSRNALAFRRGAGYPARRRLETSSSLAHRVGDPLALLQHCLRLGR